MTKKRKPTKYRPPMYDRPIDWKKLETPEDKDGRKKLPPMHDRPIDWDKLKELGE